MNRKRIIASMLAFSMTFTSIGSSVATAAEGDSYTDLIMVESVADDAGEDVNIPGVISH
jgi:hypothetical protein